MAVTSFDVTLLLGNGEIYNTSSTKKHKLGTRGFTRDGRVFRYAKNGAVALEPGRLIQAEAYGAAASEVAVSLADSTDWSVPTTNSTSVRLTTDCSLSTANFFDDGYFMVTAGTTGNEVGQMLQIDSHDYASGAAGATGCPKLYFYSEDKLVTALTTSNTVSMMANPYNRVIVAVMNDSAITAAPLGICPVAVPASYYFWLQTWGMAAAWVHGTWDTGHAVFFDSDTGCSEAGVIAAPTTASRPEGDVAVGLAQYIGVTGTAGAVFLTLSP